MKDIYLIKRNGSRELLDINKIHKVLVWACDGVSNVSPSEIEAQAGLKFHDGMKTSDLHTSLIDSAHELISPDYPNYDLVAGRLVMLALRKEVYGQFEVPSLVEIVKKNVEAGWYHKDLLTMYTPEQWAKIESFVKHERDFDFRISGAREWLDKYLVQNRKKKIYHETPQVAYVLVAAVLMRKYVDRFGISMVKGYYNELSAADGGISIPSPIAASIRTPNPQGASCTLIEMGDSIDSIGATYQAVLKYATNKAGIGLGVFNLRAEGQPVRNGDVTTTGVIGFAQASRAIVGASSQGGMRKGSETYYHNIWHLDVEKLLVLKNNKGTEETRIRHADHAFNLNGYLWKRILLRQPVTLFSPEEVPLLQKAFCDDQVEFARLYELYEQDESKTRRVIDGNKLRDMIATERSSTSRVYFHFVDNSNEQGSFVAKHAPIRMSNLCTEVTLPTIELMSLEDLNALISLCNLSAINWGAIKKPSDFEVPCRLAVFALDALLDYQPYLLPAAKNSTDWYRPLGIGVNNLAYFLAKRGLKFDEGAFEVVDEYMEAMAFYLTQASVELAELYGACGKVENTKYAQGIFPQDVRKKGIDTVIPHVERMPWEPLRARMKVVGIRNATLMCNMPSETSSRVRNMTNGQEPVRNLIVAKSGTKFVVPEYDRLKHKYQLEWDVDLHGYIKISCIMQKRMDQAISLNTRYDNTKYHDNKVPATVILNDMTLIYKLGGKTGYYHNNRKVIKSEEEKAAEVVEVVVEPEDEASCPSCVI